MSKLGIDIGGVIISRANDHTDTSFFSPNYLRTSAVPGVFEGIRRLVDVVGTDNVFIVSKATDPTAERSREWLLHHDFYKRTGMKAENVFFCHERKDKAPICARLGITHFIDDKLEVLSYLETVLYKIGFEVRPYDRRKYADQPIMLETTMVGSWPDAVAFIEATRSRYD